MYIFGSILGFLIHRAYLSKTNVLHQGPYSKEMEDMIHVDSDSNKYYKFQVQTFLCPPSFKFVGTKS